MIKGLKVLVVEDSISTQVIIKSILSFHELDIFIVGNSTDAITMLHQESLSLVVLDVNLDDGPSQPLMRYIQNMNSRLPVIVMTADLDEKIISDFYELGAKDFFHKPINVYLFSRKVKSILESYRLELENYNKTELLERIMHEKDQEESLAFYVYDHIIQKNLIDIKGVDYASLSHGKFCGDILMSAVKPNGNLLIILADATGHGMAAAITIYPLVSTFSALASKGFPSAAILQDLNEKHAQTVPQNRFIACIMVEIRHHENDIIIWNAGMPDVLLFDVNKEPKTRIKSKNMALGILPKEKMSTKFDRFSLDEVGEACLMSDGVIESKVIDGKTLSFQDVYEDIEKNKMSSEAIIEKYSSLSAANEETDDMSVCFIDFIEVRRHLLSYISDVAKTEKNGDVDFCSRSTGQALSNEEIVPNLIKMLDGYSFSPEFLQTVFLVLTELVSNALDHGVLGIPSSLKENDFLEYIQRREKGIENLTSNDFIEVSLHWDAVLNHLVISVKDSGKGYDFIKLDRANKDELHGRGLMLINKVCESFCYDKNDNKTTVVIA